MGRRPGSTTKSGRFMNPADQERKSMRQKELKRNRKQRTMVRHAILKSKDTDEILENLGRLDDQEYDIRVDHHSKYVFNEKRTKFMQTYNDIVNLYKQEKRDDIVKDLEKKMAQYEAERNRKIQQYNAQRFSLETNPVEIPLPDGVSVPNAAMTPVAPSIPIQFLIPQARAGILKNAQVDQDIVERTEPPGPPCSLPPFLGPEDDSELLPRRRVRFEENSPNDTEKATNENTASATAEEDFGPVEIPAEIMQPSSNPSLGPVIPQDRLLRAPPMPPNMLPPMPRLPLRVPPPPPRFPGPILPIPFIRPSKSSSVISAEPVVRRIEEAEQPKDSGEATISAEPKLRDLAKEVTKFVPTALMVNRNKQQPKKAVRKFNMMGIQVESAQRKEAKDTDEAYSEFMKEISSLL
ncbi:unnamed protein product [Gongylonema pulchrum]|uniref:WW domain-binding protein 11 n=1 Tax=Gongylonema pulchrum TaxID=637853 RepID=A0A183E4T4_9BILA|nr:unnamed protein product [Gongylonema pulchrum]